MPNEDFLLATPQFSTTTNPVIIRLINPKSEHSLRERGFAEHSLRERGFAEHSLRERGFAEHSPNWHLYIFIGSVPVGVRNALIRIESFLRDGGEESKINAHIGEDAISTLKKFYGSDWKATIGLAQNKKQSIPTISGGAELSDISTAIDGQQRTEEETTEEIAQIENLIEREETAAAKTKQIRTADIITTRPTAESAAATFAAGGITFIFDIPIFAEDSFMDVKMKFSVAANIPVYRIHLSALDEVSRNATAIAPYAIFLNGARIPINVLDLLNPPKEDNSLYFGMPIDRSIYAARESLRIEAYEKMMPVFATRYTHYVAIDLASYTWQAISEIRQIIDDTYQFDLIYFGFIVKYWAHFQRDCFKEFVANEMALSSIYPDLAPSAYSLRLWLDTERKIIEHTHQIAAKTPPEKLHLSVVLTSAVVTTVIHHTFPVNIRILFDLLECAGSIMEIRARTEIEQQGKIGYFLLRKLRKTSEVTHIGTIKFPNIAILETGLTVVIATGKIEDISRYSGSGGSGSFVFLNIQADGRYFVVASWADEDKMQFADATKFFKFHTAQVIANINSFNSLVFPGGSARLIPISSKNITYTALTASIIWAHAMSAKQFRMLKAKFDEYIRANIVYYKTSISVRAIVADFYEFLFSKGMYKFDHSLLSQIIDAVGMPINNYYAYLSNATIKQKWMQHYQGRVMRIINRSTDVRINIYDIHEREFGIFFGFIITLVADIAADLAEKDGIHRGDISEKTTIRRIKRLHEQDPELFNLKKHGSTDDYSILCQNPRQPIIYSEDEVSRMPKSSLAKLVKYWNFTTKKPAFYECPSANYPHLSFLVGFHPKKYCLPCCKKLLPQGTTAKGQINVVCIDKHIYEGSLPISSRHVMDYGKELEPARISKLPPGRIRESILEAISAENPSHSLCIYGMTQEMGPILTFSGILDLTPNDLMKKIIAALGKTINFETLAGGIARAHFINSRALEGYLVEILRECEICGNFPPQKMSHEFLRELLIDAVFAIFGVAVVYYFDSGADSVPPHLVIPPAIINAVKSGHISDATPFGLFILKMKTKMSEPEYYPIYEIDNIAYHRSGAIFNHFLPHSAAKFILQTIKKSIEGRVATTTIDLALLKSFSDIEILRQYIGIRGLCYGILCRYKDKPAYLPIEYSQPIQGIPKADDKQSPTVDAVKASANITLINDINARIQRLPAAYRRIAVNALIYCKEKPIAFETSLGFAYFSEYDDNVPESLPKKEFAIDPRAIGELLQSSQSSGNISAVLSLAADVRTLFSNRAQYLNYQYDLFLTEFSHYMGTQRNVKIREELIALFESGKDENAISRELRTILEHFPDDFTQIQNKLLAKTENGGGLRTVREMLETGVFDFDNVEIVNLLEMDNSSRREALLQIAKKITIKIPQDEIPAALDNTIIACRVEDVNAKVMKAAGLTLSHCVGNRLKIAADLEVLVDFLARDIENPLRRALIINRNKSENISLSFISPLQFISRPNEMILIYRIEFGQRVTSLLAVKY
ncbi:MAG: hypothetical protein M0R33_13735 [Methylomonas sp.]|jgi:hypothetical protein|uniref:hypothetical protein n=1 Tax=Methylomonas sp. TaxID=418 RepID=UPI0025F5AD8F|nr:hypothetical protein [Methylomonas sp.]MCK9607496.1 hypothetical protein [Methylomonas sp.]